MEEKLCIQGDRSWARFLGWGDGGLEGDMGLRPMAPRPPTRAPNLADQLEQEHGLIHQPRSWLPLGEEGEPGLGRVKAVRGTAENACEMNRIGKPMLFCPPHPPVALGPRDTISIGRSRSCDLRLPGADASRRHAEIAGGPNGFTITDLGSTNGTFVNGRQTQKLLLKPGDRIEIGNNMITFCQVGGGLENIGLERDRERTIEVERPTREQTFEGDLAEIPLFALLQILEMGSKSGLLSIEADQANGRLWLAHGAPIHAETKRHSGFDAAVEIVNFTGGRFTFQSHEDAAERTIEASVTELLLEASRILDEGLL